MYIPKNYLLKDQKEIIDFMQKFNFASIVSTVDQQLFATHLPFTISSEEGKIVLSSHFAAANPQWKTLGKQRSMVIFTEPHAYISTRNYDKAENVPTWNYLAVHAYGTAEIIDEASATMTVLKEMMQSFEPEYQEQWNALPDAYKAKMVKGIKAFRIRVDDLQAKHKLSQNRNLSEQLKIIDHLGDAGNENEQLITDYMRRNLSANSE